MMLNKSIVDCGFGYGKGLIGSRVKKRLLKLPTDSKGEPDYAFMEQYMRQKEQKKIEKFQNYITKRNLNASNSDYDSFPSEHRNNSTGIIPNGKRKSQGYKKI